MTGRPTRAVVFDLDGTLLDSLPLVLRAFTHALEPFGGRPTMAMFAKLGGPPERIFSEFVEDPRQVPAALRRLDEFNRENQHLIVPFTGAAAVLGALRERGVALGVWTGRDRESTEFLLRIHGLSDQIGAVVCGDDLASHKPDSAGLNKILGQLGVPAAETLYMGDADVDVLGGSDAGVDTILIRHSREPEPAVVSRAWKIVSSPSEAYECAILRTTARFQTGGGGGKSAGFPP